MSGRSVGSVGWRRCLLAVAVVALVAGVMASAGVAAEPEGLQIAADRIRVTTRWESVEFAGSFVEPPVVVAGPVSWDGHDPVTVRVRNVTESGFQIRLTEWPYLDGDHMWERVSYLAVPAGVHTLASGATVEAGSVAVAASGTEVVFADRFAVRPTVIGTIVASTDGPGLAPRLAVTRAGFSASLQSEEADGAKHPGTLNWVAWSRGSSDTDLVTWETQRRLINHRFEKVVFDRAYVRPCVLADMNSVYGDNPATLRYRYLRVRSVHLRVEEERSRDTEMAHTNERVDALILECAKNPPVIVPGFEFGHTLVGSPTVLRGHTGYQAVVAVTVAIRHRATGTWLQTDGTFGAKVQRFDATLEFGTFWSYEASLPDGDYSLSVRARDAVGNEVVLRPWHHFTASAEATASGIVLQPGDGRTSIELDAAGNPVIAYTNAGSVRVIHCNDADCGTYAGPFLVSPGSAEDLELDAAGFPVILTGTLVHCVDPNCENPGTVGNVSGSSLELDSAGNPVVSGTGESVARCVDPDCASPPIVGDNWPREEFVWSDLALDAAGNPVIASWEWSSFSGSELDLIHCVDPYCQTPASFEVADDRGFSEVELKAISLLMDASGNPVMAAKQVNPEMFTMDRLRVITCSDPRCAGAISTNDIEDNRDAGIYSSLAMTAAGLPVVAYDNPAWWAYELADLMLVRCGDPLCADRPQVAVVDNDNVLVTNVSLAVDDTDTAFVSYSDGRGNLRFARVPAP